MPRSPQYETKRLEGNRGHDAYGVEGTHRGHEKWPQGSA